MELSGQADNFQKEEFKYVELPLGNNKTEK
jgi:hypothetical protein